MRSPCVPAAGAFHPYFVAASLVVALFALGAIVAQRPGKAGASPAKVESAKPMQAPAVRNQAEAEVISFLALLQEKGRLVDFLMDDIAAYGDAQVGAAARVVHAGMQGRLAGALQNSPGPGRERGINRESRRRDTRPTNTVSSARSVGKRLSRERWSIAAGRPRPWSCHAFYGSSADRLPAIAPAEVELQ